MTGEHKLCCLDCRQLRLVSVFVYSMDTSLQAAACVCFIMGWCSDLGALQRRVERPGTTRVQSLNETLC
jgi:hypothetical protein